MFTLPYLLIDLSFSHLTSSFHIVVEFTVTAFVPSLAAGSSIVVAPFSSSLAFEDGFASCSNYYIPFLG
jgi:hypothetical protein